MGHDHTRLPVPVDAVNVRPAPAGAKPWADTPSLQCIFPGAVHTDVPGKPCGGPFLLSVTQAPIQMPVPHSTLPGRGTQLGSD